MSKIGQRTINVKGEWVVTDDLSLTPKNPGSVVIGIISSIIVRENVRRKGLILINTSMNRISLAFGTDAILDRGATLYPGGSFNMAENDFYSGDIYGIAAGVDSALSIQEFS